MKHNILLHDRKFKSKPTGVESRFNGKMHNYPATVTLDELLEAATNGQSFKPSVHTTNKASESFVSSSLLVFDIDNGTKIDGVKVQTGNVTPQDAVALFRSLGLEVAAIYTSFSHTEAWSRYRVLFELSEVCYDKKELDKAHQVIKSIVDGNTGMEVVDKQVGSVSLIYGGKEVVYRNKTAKTVDLSKITLEKVAASLDGTGFDVVEENDPTISTYVVYNKRYNCGDDYQNGAIAVCSRLRSELEAGFFDKYANKEPLTSYTEVIRYVKSLPLYEFLHTPSSHFNCIFHNDNNPSAGYYLDKDGGYHYKCFSESCGMNVDIINLVAMAYGLQTSGSDFTRILELLIKHLKLTVDINSWKEAQYALFRNNRKVLNNIQNYTEQFPQAAKALAFSDMVLRVILDRAEESIEYVPTADSYGLPLVQISLDYIEAITGMTESKVRTRMDKLLTLGIIRVLTMDEVKKQSPYYARSAKKLQNKLKSDLHISTYAINLLDETTLAKAEELMRDFKASGATSKGMTARQSIALGNNIKVQADDDSKKDKEVLKELTAWVKKTVKRNGYYAKKDLENYAKKKGYGSKYTSAFIAAINKKLLLEKRTVSQIKELGYRLSKNVTGNSVLFA